MSAQLDARIINRACFTSAPGQALDNQVNLFQEWNEDLDLDPSPDSPHEWPLAPPTSFPLAPPWLDPYSPQPHSAFVPFSNHHHEQLANRVELDCNLPDGFVKLDALGLHDAIPSSSLYSLHMARPKSSTPRTRSITLPRTRGPALVPGPQNPSTARPLHNLRPLGLKARYSHMPSGPNSSISPPSSSSSSTSSSPDVCTVRATNNPRVFVFRCILPRCRRRTFGRWCDFDRHYNGAHAAIKTVFWCPAVDCPRNEDEGTRPFPRKDKMMDHARKVHGIEGDEEDVVTIGGTS
ncbi:hypothetical protein FB567DRAFT_102980 [Paraphoma chrysanthemicola]|uniref:C2H2-type domain-containing protein n=1 Tax=Paraphoma chrysanthemicola TaxID=798071 RepID=A0A8K0R3A4_9PLEO|nr:hypothetical protein FB567DRAFT_102980 [Paraphoma chrysanthemicola]